tara:strand:+ start:3994 stop:4623 length:630 start_codon:yes stop_codon:yes gene_type:complete
MLRFTPIVLSNWYNWSQSSQRIAQLHRKLNENEIKISTNLFTKLYNIELVGAPQDLINNYLVMLHGPAGGLGINDIGYIPQITRQYFGEFLEAVITTYSDNLQFVNSKVSNTYNNHEKIANYLQSDFDFDSHIANLISRYYLYEPTQSAIIGETPTDEYDDDEDNDEDDYYDSDSDDDDSDDEDNYEDNDNDGIENINITNMIQDNNTH